MEVKTKCFGTGIELYSLAYYAILLLPAVAFAVELADETDNPNIKPARSNLSAKFPLRRIAFIGPAWFQSPA